MNENETATDNERYKKMYLKMVSAALDIEKIIKQTLSECEEIYIDDEEPPKP